MGGGWEGERVGQGGVLCSLSLPVRYIGVHIYTIV